MRLNKFEKVFRFGMVINRPPHPSGHALEIPISRYPLPLPIAHFPSPPPRLFHILDKTYGNSVVAIPLVHDSRFSAEIKVAWFVAIDLCGRPIAA